MGITADAYRVPDTPTKVLSFRSLSFISFACLLFHVFDVIFTSFHIPYVILSMLFDFYEETNQLVVDSCRGEANSDK